MTKLLRSPVFTLYASAAMVAAVTAFAYGRLGFLGVILVGLLILFMAVQSDAQRDGMRRPSAPERLSPAERMAGDADRAGMARFWRWAAIVGAALTAVGLVGFVGLQLPP